MCRAYDAAEPRKCVSSIGMVVCIHLTNIAEHFLSILVGREDDLAAITRRTETLMKEETNLSLAEVHSRIHDLSEALMSCES